MQQQKQVQFTGDDPIALFIQALQDSYADTCTTIQTPDWWYLQPKNHPLPISQGWKLHLSTIPLQAVSLLETVAPLLIESQIQWKVLRSLDHLIRFSSPPASLAQLGKFITIYPENDELAVELAALLHEKTQQFSGPVIPSDFRYEPHSLVYYRYGGFKARYFYNPRTSLRTHCILAPNGTKIPDERTTSPTPPTWAHNPFPALESLPQATNGLFERHLKLRGIFSQSIKGGVYVVSDGSETFILKEARFGTCPDKLGRTMHDRLTNERLTCSRRYAPLHIAPQPIELFDADKNRYLLMEHLPGWTLSKYIQQNNSMGEDDIAFTKRLCKSLIDLVKHYHQAGIVIRDLTPNNILVTSTGCRLIDLELASQVPAQQRPFTGYTYGYIPFEAELAARDAYAYDRYALGAVLSFLVTGVTPYLSKEQDILPRMKELLSSANFLKSPAFNEQAATALHLLHTCEFPIHVSAQVLSSAVASNISLPDTLTHSQHKKDENTPQLPFSCEEIVQQAASIATYLYEQADWQQSERLWSFTSERNMLFHPASFYGGATGIANYMCEVAHVTKDTTYYHYAQAIMDWVLKQHPFVAKETPVGLYFGYAGVPWQLARLARALDNPAYLERATSIATQLASSPLDRLDLCHGAIGIGLMQLELFQHTGDTTYLTAAQSLGTYLMEQALIDEQGGVCWSEEQRNMWGLAHGSSGIAYFLLALYNQRRDPILKSLIDRANIALLHAAVPTAHAQALSWRKDPTDNGAPWTHWCHGASGVGTYLLAASQILHEPPIKDAALKAAHAIRLSTGLTSLCQCHGLSGDGEYLLQASRTFNAPETH